MLLRVAGGDDRGGFRADQARVPIWAGIMGPGPLATDPSPARRRRGVNDVGTVVLRVVRGFAQRCPGVQAGSCRLALRRSGRTNRDRAYPAGHSGRGRQTARVRTEVGLQTSRLDAHSLSAGRRQLPGRRVSSMRDGASALRPRRAHPIPIVFRVCGQRGCHPGSKSLRRTLQGTLRPASRQPRSATSLGHSLRAEATMARIDWSWVRLKPGGGRSGPGGGGWLGDP